MAVRQVTAFVALDGSLHYYEDDAKAKDRQILHKKLYDVISDSIDWSQQRIDFGSIISESDNIVQLLQEIRREG